MKKLSACPTPVIFSAHTNYKNADMRSVCTETLALRGGYHNPELHVSMWREERYKLSVYHSPEPDPFDCPGELFDLENDPGEMNNLWFDAGMQDTKDQLIHKLSAFLIQQDTQGRARGNQALPPGFGS